MGRRVDPKEKLSDNPKPQVNRIHTPIALSFRYVSAGDDYCLSFCTNDEVRAAVNCLRMLTTSSWQQVLQSGGKRGNKAGLAYTPYSDDALKGVTHPAWLSSDIRIAGVRATQKMRVFGAYIEHVFYVLWFDREHSIVPA
jgi:hypothetical protein